MEREPFQSRALAVLANLGVARKDTPVTASPMALARAIRRTSIKAWKAFCAKFDYPAAVTARNYPRE